MVPLLNGSLSNDGAKKRRLENGHFVHVKYKVRRVSAVRDFPPGCGPNAPKIGLNPCQKTESLVVANKMQDSLEPHDAEMSNVENKSVPQEAAKCAVEIELMAGSVEEVVDTTEIVNVVTILAKGMQEPSTSLPNIATDLLKKTNKEDKEVVLKMEPTERELHDQEYLVETRPNNKYAQRRVSANRDFPPFCGRNAPPPTEEDRVRINSGKKYFSRVEKDGAKNEVLQDTLKKVMKGETLREMARADGDKIDVKDQHGITQKSELLEIMHDTSQKSSAVIVNSSICDGGLVKRHGKGTLSTSKEIVVYKHGESLNGNMSSNAVDLDDDFDREIVRGLMATTSYNCAKGKGNLTGPDNGLNGKRGKKRDFPGQEKSRLGSKTRTTNNKISSSEPKKLLSGQKADFGGMLNLGIREAKDCVPHNEDKIKVSPAGQGSEGFKVSLPRFGPNSSTHGDARNKVRECMRLFQAICRKVLRGEEAKSRHGEQEKSKQKGIRRIDLEAAKIVKAKGKEVNTDKQILGAVPGVEVGDEFQYRVELAIVGIHRLYQAGIDYMKHRGQIVAASIVASGGYADEFDSSDVLIYSGQGGNVIGKNKQPEDQKLERGNLALKNSILAKNAVRVIRGSKETRACESVDARGKVVTSYVYDGLYTVDRYWQEEGPHGKLIFKFELRRIAGQPELAWKEVKKSKKSKTREGLCVGDISGGKEIMPICAVNTIDDDKPPAFTYITRMIYRDDFFLTPPRGCDCKGECLDARTCLCAKKNGEIPYNFNGAIVEVKPLVYECGPSCRCPPSCYNRVSQHGIKFQLEIFKTESKGWGVRSLNFIPSGSFICEYTGELLQDVEAEKRTENDEYLFDIGQNYNDCSQAEATSSKTTEDGGFTIDAEKCGNVGRFINHRCSPNLYAQNVLYDHEDKRMPHIMLFAAENIPPLQELTYHYNYAVDQIHDSNGNIKTKTCYCGSSECTGRMY